VSGVFGICEWLYLKYPHCGRYFETLANLGTHTIHGYAPRSPSKKYTTPARNLAVIRFGCFGAGLISG
jgi:hypothetical protein